MNEFKTGLAFIGAIIFAYLLFKAAKDASEETESEIEKTFIPMVAVAFFIAIPLIVGWVILAILGGG